MNDTPQSPALRGGTDLAVLFERMTEGLAIHELVFAGETPVDYRLLDVNPAFEMHTGLRHAEVVGKLASQVFGVPRAPYLDVYAETARGSRARYFETYFPPLARHFRISVVPLGSSRFATVFADISARKKEEESLRRNEADLLRSQRVAQLGSYHMDVPGDSWTCTPVLDEIFGTVENPAHRLEEWVGLLHPADRAEMTRYFMEDVVGRKQAFDREYRVVRPADGRTIWVHGRGQLELSSDGAVIGMFGTIQDVTERRKLEQQVMQAQKLESLGVLAGGIAHDFNNLLTTILGNADLALRELPPDSAARDCVRDIERASRSAADLCKQMLAYSGKGRIVVQPLALNALVEEMAQLLSVSISKKAVLEYRLAHDLPTVMADVSQLRQVVLNLITNASEAIGDRYGVVTLTTGVMDCDAALLADVTCGADDLAPGRYIFLEVNDTGHGMDRETLARIFDPFFSTKFTGRGLGLAAVRGIVRGHKGGLRVRSEKDVGTSFQLLLPVHDGPAIAIGGSRQQVSTWRGHGAVLLVEDEARVLSIGRRILERSGFRVFTAMNGREALEVFQARRDELELVILDLTMPVLDGEACFKEMIRIAPQTKIIITSGYDEQDVTTRFAGKGLSGFVQKPYTSADLILKVREALG